MAQPQFKLVFIAKPPDQTLAISNLKAFQTRFSSNVRRDGDAYSIHGNVLISVRDAAGRDVSGDKDLRLFRRRRYWDLKSDNPFQIGGAEMAEGWSEDNMGGGGWRDAPSINASKGGDAINQLDEFVIFLDGHEEQVPGFYFFILLSYGSAGYRVQTSSARSIAFTEWQTILRTMTPWTVESKCTISDDSKWCRL